MFGAFFDALAREGRLENGLVAVTADHGEEFFEHGSFEHGQSVYGQLLRIPLILWGPERLRRGLEISANVQLIDIAEDPGETVNLFALRPSVSREMLVELVSSFQGLPHYAAGLTVDQEVSKEQIERLRAPGYLE